MPKFPGFTLTNYGKRFNCNLVSTAIYTDNRLRTSTIKSPIPRTNGASSCGCKVELQNKKSFQFISAYFPHGPKDINLNFFEKLKQTNDTSWILAGDFNHHHANWSTSPRALKHESSFSKTISECELVLLNDGSPTRIPDGENVRNHLPTAIDLSLVSPHLINTEWIPLPEFRANSDHIPLLISTQVTSELADPPMFTPKFDKDNANWDLYQSHLSSHTIQEIEHNNIDIYWCNVKTKIIHAANLSIPKTKKNSYPLYNPWWNEQCQVAIRTERRCNQALYRHYTESNIEALEKAKSQRKQIISKAKLEYWQSYLANKIDDYRNTSKLWKKVKMLKKQKHTIKRPLIFQGKTYSTEKDKAQLLAQQIAHKSQNNSLNPIALQRRKDFEATYYHPKADNSLPINQPFSLSELDSALASIKQKDKAPGADPVCYRMLSQVPLSFKKIILHFFNKCFHSGQLPILWKEAEVFTLLKEGKLATDPDSYRPISLTPHTSKVFERLLNVRLEYYLETNHVIPECQSGFRKFRSTTDNLVYLTENIKKTLKRNGWIQYITCFDVRKAFDKVWHVKLLSKLQTIGISGRFYDTIKNFLSDRSIRVKNQNELSERHYLDMGTPQGAVLSPTLFTIMLYDIQKLNIEKQKLLMFADDIALISEVFNLGRMKHKADTYTPKRLEQHQAAIELLEDYMMENGFSFSGEKTQFMSVVRDSFKEYRKAYIIVGGVKKEASPTIKYLGITLHHLLNWKPHFQEVATKSQSAINLLRVLAGQKWAKGTKFLVDVARALIRTRLSYGQECFFGALPHEKKILDNIEAKAIKIALGIPNTASSNRVYSEIEWISLEEERRLRCCQYVVRSKTIGQNIIKDIVCNPWNIEKEIVLRNFGQSVTLYERQTPIVEFSRPIISRCAISLKNIEKWEPYPTSPWLLKSPEYHETLKWKKSDAPLEAGAETNLFIENNLSEYLQIYTDGSVIQNTADVNFGNSGFGIFVKPPNKKYKRTAIQTKCSPFLSTFSVEMSAIVSALQIIVDKYPSHLFPKVAILTDSLSCMQALQSRPKLRFKLQNQAAILMNKIICRDQLLKIVHVPSHCKVIGNELADRLAQRATKLNEITKHIPYTRKEAYALIMSQCKKAKHLFPTYQHFPNPNGTFPNLQTEFTILLRRLRVKISPCNYTIFECQCGKRVKYTHIFENCVGFKNDTKELMQYMSKNNLTYETILNKHSSLAWEPAHILCKTIFATKYSYCF